MKDAKAVKQQTLNVVTGEKVEVIFGIVKTKSNPQENPDLCLPRALKEELKRIDALTTEPGYMWARIIKYNMN